MEVVNNAPWEKAFLLVIFVIAAIVLVRFTPLKEYLTAEQLNQGLDNAGLWAPAVYVLGYAIATCLFVPGTLLTAIGAAVFGPLYGFFYVWMGAMLGASLSFLIGRNFGRDFAASVIGARLKRYDEAIHRNGFATTLYLRLIYFPFNVMNFGMGLTAVRFRDYLLGTALGILVGTFIFTFFVGTIRDIWATGNWQGLLGWRVLLSVGLFVFSFFIPSIVKRLKGKAL